MRILMVTEHCCARVIKMGIALRKRGHEVRYLNNHISNPAFTPSMDWMGEWIDLDHLAQKLRNLPPVDIIHVHNEPDSIGVVARDVRPDLPVIFDAHDLFSVRIGKRYPDESYVFQNCDGFIFPSEGYAKHAKEFHEFDRPYRVVYSMPNNDFIQDPAPITVNGVVYEGGLRVPENDPDAPEGYEYHNYRDFRDVFSRLTHRYHIPVFVYPGNNIYEEYKNTGAIFMQNLPYAELMKHMSMYTWGLVGGPVPGIKQWDTAMPNKLFECITAGIPVISFNAKEVQEFVERWEVGISVDSIDEIPERIRDYRKYKQNVWFLQDKFTMENEIDKVLSLYREVRR